MSGATIPHRRCWKRGRSQTCRRSSIPRIIRQSPCSRTRRGRSPWCSWSTSKEALRTARQFQPVVLRRSMRRAAPSSWRGASSNPRSGSMGSRPRAPIRNVSDGLFNKAASWTCCRTSTQRLRSPFGSKNGARARSNYCGPRPREHCQWWFRL